MLMSSAKREELDIRGQMCPACLLLTMKELNQRHVAIKEGSLELIILTDDRQAISTIPVTAARMGFRAEVIRGDDGYRVRIFGSV
jgi:TusA-related sulfurtransferase